jgi:hypothetical protein
MSMAELQTLCVAMFPSSTTRGPIIAGLTELLAELSGAGLAGSAWIDGSFVTQKIDPADCDFVIVAPGIELDQAAPKLQKLVLERLKGKEARKQTKIVYRCDAYIFPDYPVIHVNHGFSVSQHAYWQKQFGFDRANQPKGMAVITLPVSQ